MADTAALSPRPLVSAPKRFTWADVEAMMRAGVIEEGGPEELLDGEIWVMPAEGEAHVNLKTWLNRVLVKGAPVEIAVACDSTLRLSETHAPSPDFYLFPSTIKPSAARGADVLLVIEIADSTVRRDLGIKGPKYREHGVREYWVVDIEKRVTHMHRLDGAWPAASPIAFEDELSPQFAPTLRFRLSDSGV
jgi:Uma2 family endonuclease